MGKHLFSCDFSHHSLHFYLFLFQWQTVIKELNRLGMIIDLSHSSRKTSRDTMEASEAPVIFSHSSAFALCNSTRNVRDDTLKMVVSISLYLQLKILISNMKGTSAPVNIISLFFFHANVQIQNNHQ